MARFAGYCGIARKGENDKQISGGGITTVKASIGHVMDLPKKTIGIRLPGEEEGGKKKKKSKAKKGQQESEGQGATAWQADQHR